MNFEAWLAAKGFDTTTITAAQRISLESMWRAETGTPAPVPTPAPAPAAGGTSFEDVMAKAKVEQDRRSAVTTLVANYLTEAPDALAQIEAVGRQAIEGGWSKEQTELALLRLSRTAGPSFHIPSNPQVNDEVVEAAVCRAAGLGRETVEKSFSDRTLTAADKHFRSGVGIQRLLILGAQANGYRNAQNGDWAKIMKAAFYDPFAAGHFDMRADGAPSNISVSGILSNVANKFLVDAFNSVESVWRKITATRPVSDFKEISGFALTGDMVYEEVAPGGQLKHGTLDEEQYGNQAKLYGKLLGLDYKDVRNDDLNAFAKINRMLGRGGAQKINKVFWTEFLDNAAFFTAGNGNYRANTDVAMTLAGLAVAEEKWQGRTDPQGEPMGDAAKYLLVPTAYDLAAKGFMTSTRISNDSGDGEANVLAGKWEVVSSSYLSNANYPGFSAITYYLLADPNDLPVIETVFLDGKEVPTVESAEMDFTRLGILFRGYHGFGVRKQEKRGGYKFKTTA